MKFFMLSAALVTMAFTGTPSWADEPISPKCQLFYLTWFEAEARACPGLLAPKEERKLSTWIEQMGAFVATGDPTSWQGADLVKHWRNTATKTTADAGKYGDACTLMVDDSDGSRSYIDFIMSAEGDRWLADIFSHPELHTYERNCL